MELVLDIATQVLNDEGLTNASLETVARRMGVKKSALYYYIRGKEELVYKCYQRSLKTSLQNAIDALTSDVSGAQRLALYMRQQLSGSGCAVALPSELEVLGPSHKDELVRLRDLHADALVAVLESGLADGSLRVEDASLTALGIIGAVSWVVVWFAPVSGGMTAEQVADGFVGLFLGGLRSGAATFASASVRPVIIEEADAPEAFDRVAQQFRKRTALVKRASEFFSKSGYNNISLDEIADNLNITRSAIYHYFSSKEELLFACYERHLTNTGRLLDAIDQLPISGREKFATTITSAIHFHAGAPGPIANYALFRSLSVDQRVRIQVISDPVEARLAGFFAQGIDDGSMHGADVRIARLAFLGAVNWLPKWFEPNPQFNVDDISRSWVHLFIDGLQTPAASERF